MARLTLYDLNRCLFYSLAILIFVNSLGGQTNDEDTEVKPNEDVDLGNTTPFEADDEETTLFSLYSTTPTPTMLDIGSFDSDIMCKIQPNGYECNGSKAFVAKFYYDVKMQDCKTYDFGALCKTQNKFSRLKECHEACREEGNKEINSMLPPQVGCLLQPDFGHCSEYHPMWYFDVTYRTCKGFSWSGCGGNVNRFSTNQLCLSVCANAVKSIYKV